jgi:hypothetical protein
MIMLNIDCFFWLKQSIKERVGPGECPVLDEDEYETSNSTTRELRRLLAREFLDNVLIPLLQEHDELHSLMNCFQKENPGPGSDFESGHVWGVAYEQVLIHEHLGKEGADEHSPYALLVRQVWDLLTRLETEKEDL